MKKLPFIFFVIVFFSGSSYTNTTLAQNDLTKSKARVMYDSKGHPEPGAMYPRLIRLAKYEKDKGSILATFEQYVKGEPSFPVYRSTDNGKTWALFSKIIDTKNHYGMRYQPQLFEVPQQVSDLPAGTILCAGSSLPNDLSSTELMLYKSSDGGRTWQFVSTIVKGGGAGPTIPASSAATESSDSSGKLNDPVWEPFLALDKQGRLICFYSDERYKKQGYNQLLAHLVSSDGGKTWSQSIFDVAVPDNIKRPGMIVTAQLPNGEHIMVYEVVGIKNNPVYCRFSDDGDNWGDPADLGTRIIDSTNGYFMSGTPYIIWTPRGGANGTLVVSAKGVIKDGIMTGGGLMINTNFGRGSWHYKETVIKYNAKLHPGGYSRSMLSIDKGKKILQLTPVPVKGNLTNIYETIEHVLN
jgi:hypothetical protein